MAETTRHRQAFDAYWRMGADRSIERLHADLAQGGRAPSLRTLYGWSSAYHWQARLLELEREARRTEDSARINAIREMQERQTKEAMALQHKGVEWLSRLTLDSISGEAAIRAIVEGARLERLVRGEATQRTELSTSSVLEELTDEQLRDLVRRTQRGAD